MRLAGWLGQSSHLCFPMRLRTSFGPRILNPVIYLVLRIQVKDRVGLGPSRSPDPRRGVIKSKLGTGPLVRPPKGVPIWHVSMLYQDVAITFYFYKCYWSTAASQRGPKRPDLTRCEWRPFSTKHVVRKVQAFWPFRPTEKGTWKAMLSCPLFDNWKVYIF